jgi:mRNA interferase MazF
VNRGDIFLGAPPRDFGKPRPALIVQADLFNVAHDTIVVCLLSSHLVESSWFRLRIQPSAENGLTKPSQIMIDKMTLVKREKLRKKIGRVDAEFMSRVDRALRIWLGLETPHLPA